MLVSFGKPQRNFENSTCSPVPQSANANATVQAMTVGAPPPVLVTPPVPLEGPTGESRFAFRPVRPVCKRVGLVGAESCAFNSADVAGPARLSRLSVARESLSRLNAARASARASRLEPCHSPRRDPGNSPGSGNSPASSNSRSPRNAARRHCRFGRFWPF